MRDCDSDTDRVDDDDRVVVAVCVASYDNDPPVTELDALSLLEMLRLTLSDDESVVVGVLLSDGEAVEVGLGEPLPDSESVPVKVGLTEVD